MNYAERINALQLESNAILAQISQPLARLNFIQGQMELLAQMALEDEAAKKLVAEAANKAIENSNHQPVSEPTEVPTAE
jgi:hypothetical protein